MSEAEKPPALSAVFLTRVQAGQRLGLSIRQIRKLEEQGKLHGTRRAMVGVPGYCFVFREEEIEALARARQFVGEPVAELRDAKVFRAFQSGMSVVDIVIEMQLPADVVERLWKLYAHGRTLREGAPPAPPSEEELEAREARIQREHEERLKHGFDDLRRTSRRPPRATKRRLPA